MEKAEDEAICLSRKQHFNNLKVDVSLLET